MDEASLYLTENSTRLVHLRDSLKAQSSLSKQMTIYGDFILKKKKKSQTKSS